LKYLVLPDIVNVHLANTDLYFIVYCWVIQATIQRPSAATLALRPQKLRKQIAHAISKKTAL
jgi:hypothetical protein